MLQPAEEKINIDLKQNMTRNIIDTTKHCPYYRVLYWEVKRQKVWER